MTPSPLGALEGKPLPFLHHAGFPALFGHDPGSGYRFLDPHPSLHEPLECLGPSDQSRRPKGIGT